MYRVYWGQKTGPIFGEVPIQALVNNCKIPTYLVNIFALIISDFLAGLLAKNTDGGPNVK